MKGSHLSLIALVLGSPLLQILNARDSFLRIAHHLPKEVGKARLAELLRPAAVQRSVVDGLAVGRVSQARLGAPRPICYDLAAGERRLARLRGCHLLKLYDFAG